MVDKEQGSSVEGGMKTAGALLEKNLAEVVTFMESSRQKTTETINGKADEIRASYKPLCTTVWKITSGEELMSMLAEYFINESGAYNKAQPAYNKKE